MSIGIDVGNQPPSHFGRIDAEFRRWNEICRLAIRAIETKYLRRALVRVPGIGIDLLDIDGTIEIEDGVTKV